MLGLNLSLGLGSLDWRTLTQRAMAAIRRAGGTVLQSGLIRNYFDSAGTMPATVDNPVGLVQDSVGSNNATQPTTGSKPTLRRDANGRYYWQFDPAAPGDFLQTSITTGNEGWICAGVTFGGALANKETVFSSGAGAANLKGVWLTRLESVSNQLRMGIGNGTELTMPTHVGVELLNTKRVVEGGWDATTVFVGVDGATTSLARTGSASPSPSPLYIGRYVSGAHFLQGAMPVTIICPTLPPPADRALIRAWVAKQQGQTL